MTLSPIGTVLVCDGDQLQFICSITGRFLEWNIVLTTDDGINSEEYTRLVSMFDQAPSILVVNSVMLNFSVISPPDSLPLMSMLLISPVIDNLNGTEVTCLDRITRDSSHSATISIINNSTSTGKILQLVE